MKKSVAITSVRIDHKLMRTVRRLALAFDTSANTVICDSIAFYSRALAARRRKK